MTFNLLAFIVLLPSIFCVLASAYLCNEGREGWGWFLFVAIVLWAIPYTKKDEPIDDEPFPDERTDQRS